MSQQHLIGRLCRDLPAGKLEWIGLRSTHNGQIVEVDAVRAIAERGLEGDHRVAKTPGSGRQVTLISHEFIAQICGHLGLDQIPPALLRRNLVVSGINLNALRYQQIRVGSQVIIEAGALCHPCSRMESALGKGAVAAMLGYGGLCAKILCGGEIRVGDLVQKIDHPLPIAPRPIQGRLL
ncbi:MOSC domain-containing protein [Teredinibacter turnerae]|uniref:MOSC domain-containing protein n=1 Tax=Teredinibacter turnerae TaxID=2426 RepID=UPI00036A4DEC|nr:MOSC domain-containing protein [Teredinibacter turnerae]